MPDVFANGRSVVHQGDGLQHVAAPPDVCKTPAPPGPPIPIPYPNIAMDAQLTKGTKKVKVNGKPAATASSEIAMSSGDEAGTAGGVVSGKNMGKLTWGSASPDVKFEGNGVVRFMDVTQHNGNTFNTAFVSPGGRTAMAYADDFGGPCPICGRPTSEHRVHETVFSQTLCQRVLANLQRVYPGLSNSQKNRWGSKFMLGVMICKCGKAFVARSGSSPPTWVSAAKIPGVFRVIDDEAASPADLTAAGGGGIARELRIRRKWAQAKARSSARAAGYNEPGKCAAMKLFAKAGTHAPNEMTELMFDASATWAATYNLRTDSLAAPATITQIAAIDMSAFPKTATPFGLGGQTVASCHTCQRLIYMANCPPRTCS